MEVFCEYYVEFLSLSLSLRVLRGICQRDCNSKTCSDKYGDGIKTVFQYILSMELNNKKICNNEIRIKQKNKWTEFAYHIYNVILICASS